MNMALFSSSVSTQTASPCVGICLLDADECCTGCGRTMPEIAAWPLANELQRQTIVALAAARLAANLEPTPQPEPRA